MVLPSRTPFARGASPENLETERGYEAFRERMREAAESKQQVTIRLDADAVPARVVGR
jgi:uncharacterized protein (DUF4415 family)